MRASMELTDYGRRLGLISDDLGTLNTTVAGEERREVNSTLPTIRKSSNAYTLRFQVLEGPRNVQEAFTSGADHRHRSSSQLREIGCRSRQPGTSNILDGTYQRYPWSTPHHDEHRLHRISPCKL